MEQKKKIEITGAVGRDPELRATPEGKTFTRVSIVNNDDPKQAKWYSAVFWEDKAQQIVEAVKKGAKVKASGDLVPREYEKDGQKRTELELRSASLELVAPPRDRGERVEVSGTVAREPELKTTDTGRTLARLSVVNNDDPKQPKWHTALFWDDRAKEIARDIRKGMEVKVSGELTRREYEKDGETRTTAEIRRPNLEVLSKAKSKADRGEPQQDSPAR